MKCLILLEFGFCGECYSRKRGRSSGHGKSLDDRSRDLTPWEEYDMAMKRPEPDAPGGLRTSALDEVFRGWLPDLHDRLTETAWDDGKPRKTDSLMIVTENGRWKAWLHDRDGKRGAWVSGESWEDVLETLNKAVMTAALEWRRDTR